MASKRAGIYSRISLDRDGDSVSPERQEAICRQTAEARWFEIVGTWSDRNASAWQKRAKRPKWEDLREAIRRGDVNVLMAYSLTRLGRRNRELADLAEFLQTHGCDLVVVDQNYDTTTPGGRLVFTFMSGLAEFESDQIIHRVKSATGLRAQQGRMHTGGRRQYGYERDSTINKAEAAIVRRVADDLISGRSLRQCAFDLNAAGHLTSAGNQWTAPTLRQMLRSPRLAGLRQHGDLMLPGNWEPIIPEARWLELRSLIDARGKRGAIETPRHLLSGLAKCGRCGHNLNAHHGRATATRGGQDGYACLKRPGSDACGALSAAMGSLDRYVIDEFVDFMGRAKISVGDEDSGRSLAEVKASRIEAEASVADLSRRQYITHDPQLPDDVFAATIAELTERLELLRREVTAVERRQADSSHLLAPGSPEAIRAWWSTATLAEQRLALSRAMHYITVNPAKVRGGNVFDTSRVEIAWSHEFYGPVMIDTFLGDRLVVDPAS